jgi:hypothetical protein
MNKTPIINSTGWILGYFFIVLDVGHELVGNQGVHLAAVVDVDIEMTFFKGDMTHV